MRRSAWERTGDDEDRKGKQEHAGLVRVEALRLIPDGLVARAASNRGLEAGIELEYRSGRRLRPRRRVDVETAFVGVDPAEER